jgi:diguanylate cyclase (GGDEF)-like protein
MRNSDTICRQGGDEFVVLLPRIDARRDAVTLAEKLTRAAEEPLTLEGRELLMTVSVGVAVYPDDGNDHEALMRHADADMYRTRKGNGERRGSPLADRDEQVAVTRERTDASTIASR